MNDIIPRHIIASLLSPTSDQAIRQWYQDTLQQECPVRTLHLTFIPPFKTNNVNQLPQESDLIPTLFTSGQPACFTHPERTILYLPLQPAKPLIEIYQTLSSKLTQLISPETNHEPEFLPHITINYNLTTNLPPMTPPTESITLIPPQLLTETAPGMWQCQ